MDDARPSLRHPPSRAGLGGEPVAALDALEPAAVLIEGPPDADDLIRFAASPGMVPPLAMLVHAADDPATRSLLSLRGVLARMAGDALGARARAAGALHRSAGRASARAARTRTEEPRRPIRQPTPTTRDAATRRGASVSARARSARRAGRSRRPYRRRGAGGTPWSSSGAGSPRVFAAIEEAMTALRAAPRTPAPAPRRAARGRSAKRICASPSARRSKETTARSRSCCGAWHVPALRAARRRRGRPRAAQGLAASSRPTATWVPWTETRLAAASGYGAGVISPGWYRHLWQQLTGRDGAGAIAPDLRGALAGAGRRAAARAKASPPPPPR